MRELDIECKYCGGNLVMNSVGDYVNCRNLYCVGRLIEGIKLVNKRRDFELDESVIEEELLLAEAEGEEQGELGYQSSVEYVISKIGESAKKWREVYLDGSSEGLARYLYDVVGSSGVMGEQVLSMVGGALSVAEFYDKFDSGVLVDSLGGKDGRGTKGMKLFLVELELKRSHIEELWQAMVTVERVED